MSPAVGRVAKGAVLPEDLAVICGAEPTISLNLSERTRRTDLQEPDSHHNQRIAAKGYRGSSSRTRSVKAQRLRPGLDVHDHISKNWVELTVALNEFRIKQTEPVVDIDVA
jgi:hypothetical protein